MNRLVLCSLAALVLLTGCKKDVSGSYIESDSAAVSWLQLVRTPDNHLTGQFVSSGLKESGNIDHRSASLTGAINGENITLTSEGLFGVATTTLSGTFDGNTIVLTCVQSTPVIFKRATIADYQARLSEQSAHSQAILSARAVEAERKRNSQTQKNFVANLDGLIGEMQRFDTQADVHLGRFPNVEKGYESITAKVNEYVSRERELVGKPSRGVDRSQLNVAATQAALDTDQMHFEGQALRSSLETNITPLMNNAATNERLCLESRPVDENFTAAERETHEATCKHFMDVLPMFRQKYAAMGTGLDHLENVYKREKDAQTRLLTASQNMN